MTSKDLLSSPYAVHLSLARTLCKEAGNLVLTATNKKTTTAKSNAADLVTATDLTVQKFILDTLKRHYPDDELVGEEDGRGNREIEKGKTWIVDPIDGTTNFCHSLPDVAVSIAYAEDGKVVLGVVYNPFRQEEYYAIKSYGAYCNSLPVHASPTTSLSESVIITEFGYERSPKGVDAMLQAVRNLMLEKVRALKMYGSGTLDFCYVAKGVVDACYGGLANEGWKVWDYAAAGLIATEAGAELVTLKGDEFYLTSPTFLCCAKGIKDELIAVINKPNT